MPMISRRNFLQRLATGAVVGIVAPAALAELLAPKRTIFLPPRGGWLAKLGFEWVTDTVEFDVSTSVGYNAGVPQFLTVYFNPKILEILAEPIKLEGYPANEIFDSLSFDT
jgi:hypothetical protein